MATKSEIVTDQQIQSFKDAIEQYKKLKVEAQMAVDAGLPIAITPKDIDEKIKATAKIIEVYTGQRYSY